jgi:hypothetical protein
MKSIFKVFNPILISVSCGLICAKCLYSQNSTRMSVYSPEIKALPNFESIQNQLDYLWDQASIIEKKLNGRGYSFEDFGKICQDLDSLSENEYADHFGIGPDDFNSLWQVYCCDFACCGTVCLPKNAYEIEAYEWINPCGDLEPIRLGDGRLAAVSSTLAPKGNISYEKENLIDGNLGTAWVEGAVGYGIGEAIIFRNVSPHDDSTLYLQINTGIVKTLKAWRENSRVKGFNLYFNRILQGYLALEDTRDTQLFKVPVPAGYSVKGRPWIAINEVKFEIADVYKGEKYDDTAVTRLDFTIYSSVGPRIK